MTVQIPSHFTFFNVSTLCGPESVQLLAVFEQELMGIPYWFALHSDLIEDSLVISEYETGRLIRTIESPGKPIQQAALDAKETLRSLISDSRGAALQEALFDKPKINDIACLQPVMSALTTSSVTQLH